MENKSRIVFLLFLCRVVIGVCVQDEKEIQENLNLFLCFLRWQAQALAAINYFYVGRKMWNLLIKKQVKENLGQHTMTTKLETVMW